MPKHPIYLTIFSLLLTLSVFAQEDEELLYDSLEIDSADVAIVQEFYFAPDNHFVVMLDSLYRLEVFCNSNLNAGFDPFNKYQFSEDSIPVWPDSIIEQRLQRLNAQTPMELEYNDIVAAFINLYANKRRKMMPRVLGLSSLYYPIFEEELDKANLPLELKHLAVVESALTNNIRSHAGAVGLWQFMYRTARYMGMDIDSYIDERRDPVKSTQTAVKYLTYLHNLYDDWFLALAAYNAGPGNVNKAIRRSGGKRTYWEVRPYLPRETRGYVPAFIAANYIMNYAEEHNLYAIAPKYTFEELDTIRVKKPVNFYQISEVLCIAIEDLNFLNPQYKRDFIPVSDFTEKQYDLVLPYYLAGDYVNNEEYISEYKSPEEIEEEQEKVEQAKEITHRVRSGESLGLIANRYKVSVHDLKQWNNLRGSTIHPGQVLRLYSSVDHRSVQNLEQTTKKDGYLFYTIRNGDTLWDIAKKYDGVSVKSLMSLNNLSNNSVLSPGDKIKIKKL